MVAIAAFAWASELYLPIILYLFVSVGSVVMTSHPPPEPRHGVAAHGALCVGAQFADRGALVFSQVIVHEEVVLQDQLPPCIHLPLQVLGVIDNALCSALGRTGL
jgi:hypothetical protein